MKTDINCDLGEGYPNDAEIMPFITSANIACGYHAGDEDTMRRTIAMAIEKGVHIGAHPSFKDRENFGRREMVLKDQEIYDLVSAQLYLMDKLARGAGVVMKHVKPHGALYNMSARDPQLAYVTAHAVMDFNPERILFGLSGSASIREAEKLGLATRSEVFADRTYQSDGSLTPRSSPGALIEDEQACVLQVQEMIRNGRVMSTAGSYIPMLAQTICLHGDGENAVAFARLIHNVVNT